MSIEHRFDVIDGHHHYGNLLDLMPSLQAVPSSQPVDFERKELETRLSILDRQSVRQAVILAGHGYLRAEGLSDTRRVNDGVAAYRDRTPDRFPAAVGLAEPLYGTAGLSEINRCADELGMVGISFHVRFQGVSLDSPWVFRYIERVGEADLIPYVHAIGDSPEESLWKVDVLAAAFPDLTMFVLDAFSNFEQAREVVQVADRRPNLVFDTALAYNYGLIEPVIAQFGVRRFFYGSDIYSWPATTRPAHLLEEILESKLPDEDKATLLGGNLRSLLGLE